MQQPYFFILIYSIIIVAIGFSFILLSHLLGPKGFSKQKFRPYECGVSLPGTKRQKIQVPFYLVATFFILFDIETVFLVPWAINFHKMSSIAIWEMILFLFILSIGLIYILKKKILQFDGDSHR